MGTVVEKLGLVAAAILMLPATAEAANLEHLQQLKQTHSCENCDLSHADLRVLDLEKADLSYANLSSANLSGMNLNHANLSGANLTAANFTAANLARANFKGAFNQSQCDDVFADLAQLGAFAVWNQSRQSDHAFACSMTELIDLARIAGVLHTVSSEYKDIPISFQFMAVQFRTMGVALKRERTSFYKANLQNANLEDARLQGADFRLAQLDRANLSNANLSNSLFFATSLGNIKVDRLNSNYVDIAVVRQYLQNSLNKMIQVWLAQAKRAIELNARTTIGIIIRSQQAFHLNHERFALELDELQVDVSQLSEKYIFELFALQAPVSDAFPSEKNRAVWIVARPRKPQWQSYIGLVWLGLQGPTFSLRQDRTAQPFSLSIVCGSNQFAQVPLPPRLKNQGLNRSDAMCPQGYSLVK